MTDVPDAPEGVRIEHADGAVTPCDMICEPERDANGFAVWTVVLPPGGRPLRIGDSLAADKMPGRSVMRFPVAATRAELEAGLRLNEVKGEPWDG